MRSAVLILALTTQLHAQDLAGKVTAIFKAHNCLECHAASPAERTNTTLFHLDDMAKVAADLDLIDPGNPNSSGLIIKIRDNMPRLTAKEKAEGKKAAGRVSKEDEDTLMAWMVSLKGTAEKPAAIARPIVSEKALAAAIAQDVADQKQRPGVKLSELRYVSLAALHNNATDVLAKELPAYRAATRFILNSLSTTAQIAKFEELGPEKVLLRVHLGDLGWTAADWDHLQSQNLQALDPGEYATLAADLRTKMPVARAEWLAPTAMAPANYARLIRLPATQQKLEAELGVNVFDNLRTGRALRAAFNDSGVSDHNRMFEQHKLTTRKGSLYISVDFASSFGKGSLVQRPIGPPSAKLGPAEFAFEHDGGEIIFHLRNGLQGFQLTDADGNPLPKGEGPEKIVKDKKNALGSSIIRNGISCIVCHEGGLLPPPPDIVVPAAASFDLKVRETILSLHRPADLAAALAEDNKLYAAALAEATGGTPLSVDNFHAVPALLRYHSETVSAERAAAELGLSLADFQAKLPDALRKETLFRALGELQKGGRIKRDAFLADFGELAERLALGKAIAPARAVAARVVAAAATAKRTFTVAAAMDRAEYRFDDPMKLTVRIEDDCFLRIVYKDSDGKLHAMFPNKEGQTGHVKKTDNLQTGKGSALNLDDFVAQAPDGPEEVIVIASETQFTDAAEFLKKSIAGTPLDAALETVITESVRSTEEFIAKGAGRRLNSDAKTTGLGVGIARVGVTVLKK